MGMDVTLDPILPAEFQKVWEGAFKNAMIYGNWTVSLPSGLQGINLGEPVFDEEFEHLSITPKLIETVKSGSRQADALIKQKTALTSKALSQWFGQLDIQMENQYRYRCMCPSPKCRKAVEFFSYKTQDVINLNDVPKCGECDGK